MPGDPSVRDKSMPPPVSPLRELLQVVGTLLIAAVGGIGFYLIGFPGGLVSGSMLTVAVAALAGCAVKIPLSVARLCFVLVGILLARWLHQTRSRGS